ncbi:MAG: Hsp70 family protein [Pseudomonadota bacterium]
MSTTIDYGIDLGTTNSCIAVWQAGALRIFQNNDQMNVTPSAVHILRTGRVIVGRRAQSALLTDLDNVAVEFKRWMGQKDRKSFPATQRELSAEELSAEVLKSLREDVRRQSGAEVKAAVITVPAAFGALQCEATARAAELAGFEEAPLLQEPIAAAIGYGATPDSARERWLVFDLGGGTLDIAVVSTQGGRLNILEHRGDNLLGGKDIDRMIVERALLPVLEATYDLRASGPGSARRALLSKLRGKAEEAKIDLSREQEVIVSLFDVGDDDAGVPIQIDVPLKRAQLDTLVAPLMEKACALAAEALAGARVSGSDLARILLVGGPTQTPFVRALLRERLGAPVDFAVDPMTVVARGAAIYASALRRTSPQKGASPDASSPSTDGVQLKLAYDPVSAELQSVLAGRVLDTEREVGIKIEAEGGLWTSGWLTPKRGHFETVLSLKPSDVTTFWVYARDARGNLLQPDVAEFSVRHGLVPGAPPLPHTLSIEVVDAEGRPALDAVFSKGTPLPAEKKLKYRAKHEVAPNKPNTDLAIKLWEGEFLDDPDANEWVGNVLLSHSAVKRVVPQGAEVEINLQISASRAITVEAFIPHLNLHFGERLYVPQRDEQDFVALSREAVSQAHTYQARLDQLGQRTADVGTRSEVTELRQSVAALAVKTPRDPDDARGIVEESKKIRGRLGRLERRVSEEPSQNPEFKFAELVQVAENAIARFGTTLDKQQLSMLRRELERTAAKDDERGIARMCEEVEGLRFRVLSKHDWFWRENFEQLTQDPGLFVDAEESRGLIARGRAALQRADGNALQEVVRALWKLQPKKQADVERERALRSGLRRF